MGIGRDWGNRSRKCVGREDGFRESRGWFFGLRWSGVGVDSEAEERKGGLRDALGMDGIGCEWEYMDWRSRCSAMVCGGSGCWGGEAGFGGDGRSGATGRVGWSRASGKIAWENSGFKWGTGLALVGGGGKRRERATAGVVRRGTVARAVGAGGLEDRVGGMVAGTVELEGDLAGASKADAGRGLSAIWKASFSCLAAVGGRATAGKESLGSFGATQSGKRLIQLNLEELEDAFQFVLAIELDFDRALAVAIAQADAGT